MPLNERQARFVAVTRASHTPESASLVCFRSFGPG
jgi:hypothetical protein